MSAAKTALSIILTSQNQLNSLKLTLLGLIDQRPHLPVEIIVVDCGSEDGTDQFLMTQAENGTIRVVFSAAEMGRTAARNKGAAAAEGRHLMFLDPGMLVGPGWWVQLFRVLEMDPRVAATSGRILLPNGVIDHAGLSLLRFEATKTARPRLGCRTVHAGKPGDHAPAEKSLQVRALPGEAVMTRATAFFSAGGFSTRLGREHGGAKPDFAGDPAGIDYGLRLQQQGWTCVYQPGSIMTRLRRVTQEFEAFERDMSTLGRTWLDRITPDFSVFESGRVFPVDRSAIKPYVEPQLDFQDARARGLIRAEGARSQPGASIILDADDNLEATRRAVDSVVRNTAAPHELLLLDSGRDAELNRYLTSVADQHPGCQLILADPNASRAENLNRALVMTKGRHVVLLENRVEVASGWLDTLVGVAELCPDAGLVGPMTNGFAGMQQAGGIDYDTQTGDGFESYALGQMLNHSSDRVRTIRLSGFCLLIKRELLARIGGLDPIFQGGYYEFNDYSLRAQMAGFLCQIARGCFVHQNKGAQPPAVDEQQMIQIEMQWELFKRKWKIPGAVRLDSRLDLASLLLGDFDPAVHFQALGPTPEAAPRAREFLKEAAQS